MTLDEFKDLAAHVAEEEKVYHYALDAGKDAAYVAIRFSLSKPKGEVVFTPLNISYGFLPHISVSVAKQVFAEAITKLKESNGIPV